ncbi:hypothetical protein DFJ58DRAFT_842253 [Suillus subalutaceus]|uniref:uncharacterized protein n=1 Tax=Suillus subalutaceus TaxID=48586 RepID=UPI001B88231A|nr:uncharacterized protein DFJ58DRAFT_842253 [Suillus subalutaceus]KAG1851058.1 hypothetical protein DFJ58DRAFT_842253 [Suillus subalutaceus]
MLKIDKLRALAPILPVDGKASISVGPGTSKVTRPDGVGSFPRFLLVTNLCFLHSYVSIDDSNLCENDRNLMIQKKATLLDRMESFRPQDDSTVVGDPTEKTTSEALDWRIMNGNEVVPSSAKSPNASRVFIRHHFQFSSALKRMSTVSSLPSGKVLVAVKGAPDMIKGILTEVPEWYNVTYKWYTRHGSHVLALRTKEMMSIDKLYHPVGTLKMLADLLHRRIMITGDNPSTVVHVVLDIEIVDCDTLILDLRANPAHEAGELITVQPFKYRLSWNDLVQNTWVCARVSPTQKEFVLTSLKTLGYTWLMAGDDTDDVGALEQAHIDVVKAQTKVAENLQVVHKKNLMEKVVSVVLMRVRWLTMFEFDLASITDAMANMEGYEDVPQIKLGNPSCTAPFTSKLSHITPTTHIIRRGHCTLVSIIQMYKILTLNRLITAYSLPVQYLDGIKFGDNQLVEKNSQERPLGNIFNLYVLLPCCSSLPPTLYLSLIHIMNLPHFHEPAGVIDLKAMFEPSLLNAAIHFLGLSTGNHYFAEDGCPFREGIRKNSSLYWVLAGASTCCYILWSYRLYARIEPMFKVKLTSIIIAHFVGCWVIEKFLQILNQNRWLLGVRNGEARLADAPIAQLLIPDIFDEYASIRASVTVQSNKIANAALHVTLPWYTHLYTIPFFSLYPLLAYRGVNFPGLCILCAQVSWSLDGVAKAWITMRKVRSIEDANCICLVPRVHRGQGKIAPSLKAFENLNFDGNKRMKITVTKSAPGTLASGANDADMGQATEVETKVGESEFLDEMENIQQEDNMSDYLKPKIIQTISLLAHLACDCGIWDCPLKLGDGIQEVSAWVQNSELPRINETPQGALPRMVQ